MPVILVRGGGEQASGSRKIGKPPLRFNARAKDRYGCPRNGHTGMGKLHTQGWISRMVRGLCGAERVGRNHHADVPAGPAIVLVCGVVYFISLLAAPGGLLVGRLPVRHHLKS